MSSSEETIVRAAREVLSSEEVERMAGLFRLRHHPNRAVRSAANAELIELLDKLEKSMTPAPLRAV